MYSLGNVLQKEPVVIAGALRSILWVAVLMGVVFLDEKQLAGIAIGLEVLLGLFTRQQTTPTASPTLPLGTPVTVSGTGDVPPPDDAYIGSWVRRELPDGTAKTRAHYVESVIDSEPITRCGRRLRVREGTAFAYSFEEPVDGCRVCKL